MKRIAMIIGAAALFSAPAIFAQGIRGGFAGPAVNSTIPVAAPAKAAPAPAAQPQRGSSTSEVRTGRSDIQAVAVANDFRDRGARDGRGGRGEGRHDHDHGHNHGHNNKPDHYIEYRTVEEVIPGYYKTVERQVWVAGFYETVHETVCIPGHYENRPCTTYIGCVAVTTTHRVWVPERHEVVCKQVYRPGHYKTVCEQVWIPPQTVCKQVPVVVHNHR